MSYSWAGAKHHGWAARRRTYWFRKDPNQRKSRIEEAGEEEEAAGKIFPIGSRRRSGEKKIIKKARIRWLRYMKTI